jgi:hypothetical protein
MVTIDVDCRFERDRPGPGRRSLVWSISAR